MNLEARRYEKITGQQYSIYEAINILQNKSTYKKSISIINIIFFCIKNTNSYIWRLNNKGWIKSVLHKADKWYVKPDEVVKYDLNVFEQIIMPTNDQRLLSLTSYTRRDT